MAKFQVIKGATLPSSRPTSSAELEDFRSFDALLEFMPSASRFAMGWLRLGEGNSLELRRHGVRALLIVCDGSGLLRGDLQRAVGDGDVVVIPAGSQYGLVAGAQGLSAVSIQLGQEPGEVAERSEDASDERQVEQTLDGLLEYAAGRLRMFEQCALFTVPDGGTLEDPQEERALRDAFRVWVNAARGLLFDGHGTWADESNPRDSILAALASWFAYQSCVLDSAERTAITQLVIEPAQVVCEHHASRLLGRSPRPPSVAALESRRLAGKVLRNQSPRTYAALRLAVQEAWDMMDAMTDRVVELSHFR